MKFGYKPLNLYHREGEARKLYIESLRQADRGNMEALKTLIEMELVIFKSFSSTIDKTISLTLDCSTSDLREP